MTEMIKAIIFDFGGVISYPQNEETMYQMIDILKINYADFVASYVKHRHLYDAGLITGQEYWTRIYIDHAIDVRNSDILKLIELDVKGWTRINTMMLDFILSLQNSVIKTAVLSNMTSDIWAHVQALHQWINDFDTCIFSYKYKLTKPEKRLYEICIEALRVDPVNCLFIDDTKQNIIAAQELGINTIHFLNDQDFNQKLLIQYYI